MLKENFESKQIIFSDVESLSGQLKTLERLNKKLPEYLRLPIVDDEEMQKALFAAFELEQQRNGNLFSLYVEHKTAQATTLYNWELLRLNNPSDVNATSLPTSPFEWTPSTYQPLNKPGVYVIELEMIQAAQKTVDELRKEDVYLANDEIPLSIVLQQHNFTNLGIDRVIAGGFNAMPGSKPDLVPLIAVGRGMVTNIEACWSDQYVPGAVIPAVKSIGQVQEFDFNKRTESNVDTKVANQVLRLIK